jgi:nucleotide-binding universal stress UspA family protein
MERTVVGFDGSEHVRKALARAADLAEDGVTLPCVRSRGGPHRRRHARPERGKRLLLRSVSINVVQHAPCDVLVARSIRRQG